MEEDSLRVTSQALEVLRGLKSPFSKWEFFKSYSAHFGSKPPHAELGFANLCDFIESFPEVQLVRSPGLYSFKEEKAAEETSILVKPEESQESEGKTKLSSQQLIEHSDDESTILSRSTDEDDRNGSRRGSVTRPSTSEDARKTEATSIARLEMDKREEEQKEVPTATVLREISSPTILPSFEEFKTCALSIAADLPPFFHLGRFSSAYCVKYCVSSVPFKELGFSTLFECLQGIPEIGMRLNMASPEEKRRPSPELAPCGTVAAPSVMVASPVANSQEIPVPASRLTANEFKEQVLQVAGDLPRYFHAPEFSHAYCQKFGVCTVPFNDFGFSTLIECLQAIPALFGRLDVSFETDILDIVQRWRNPFAASEVATHYRRRTGAVSVPCVKYGYENLRELVEALPGIKVVDRYNYKYEKPSSKPISFPEGPSISSEGETKQQFTNDRANPSLSNFKAMAIAAATSRCPPNCCARAFSKIYCDFYRTPCVPFKELGFSTLVECLYAVPELAKNVDMSLELELFEIISQIKTATFHPLDIVVQYCTRNNVAAVPLKKYGYENALDLLTSMPKVTRVGQECYRFDGERKATESGQEAELSDQKMEEKPENGSGDASGSVVAAMTSLSLMSQSTVTESPQPATSLTRNELIGRFVTALLDDAEKKGLDTNEIGMKAVTFFMGFNPQAS